VQDYFFIVGSGRSGTTLLSVILDRHTRLCVTPETAFFDEVAPSLVEGDDDRLIAVLGSWRRLPELGLKPEDVRQKIGATQWGTTDVLAAILDLYALRSGKIRCGEKTPQHLVHVPEILRCFPQAKVICVLRGCMGHRRTEAGREELAFLERFLHNDLRRHGYEPDTRML
jgi:hypothetical protein